jgi:hypothetical protein
MYLEDLFVTEAARGRAVGRRLITQKSTCFNGYVV